MEDVIGTKNGVRGSMDGWVDGRSGRYSGSSVPVFIILVMSPRALPCRRSSSHSALCVCGACCEHRVFCCVFLGVAYLRRCMHRRHLSVAQLRFAVGAPCDSAYRHHKPCLAGNQV
jgi:hypothetical protein